MPEVPFPADPECLLEWGSDWPEDAVGHITFVCPSGKHRNSIPITRKLNGWDGDHPTYGNVWEFRYDGPQGIATHPSIDAICCCHWHSPNPTRWRLVERLADGK